MATSVTFDQDQRDALKVAVCEYLLRVNENMDGPFIPPTAIDWLGNGLVDSVVRALAPETAMGLGPIGG